MKKLRYGFAALLLATCIGARPSRAEIVSIPYPAALAFATNQSCYAADALGWRPFDATATCKVAFPVVVPIGKTIKQIIVLHGTTDFAAQSEIEAGLNVYPATAPWQPATYEFAYHDATIFPGFDVVHASLMQQIGKVFPDAFVVLPTNLYYVNVSVSYSAFVAGIQVYYD
jgi:hypothetical protein